MRMTPPGTCPLFLGVLARRVLIAIASHQSTSTMSSDLPSLLLASLQPSSRKQAETSLTSLSTQPGFILALLRLVLDERGGERAVRLAGGVYLKNLVKLRWEEDVNPISEQDKVALRAELVPGMIVLSNPADKTIRAQVAESVSLIAELDFPEKWETLIDVRVLAFFPPSASLFVIEC